MWPFSKLNVRFKEKKIAGNLIHVEQAQGTVWTEDRYDLFAKEAYIENSIGFRSIYKVASSVSSVPWKLYRKVNGERVEIDQHPVLRVLNRPNPVESWVFLMIKLVAYLEIAGDTYIRKISPSMGANAGVARELEVLRPDRMEIMINKETGMIIGYIYKINNDKKEFFVDPITGQCDILHIKYFHPLNDWYGLSATRPVSKEIDIKNEATSWNKNLMANQARPGLIYNVKGSLTEEQWNRMESQLNNRSGSANAGKNFILESTEGATVSPYGWSPTEVDFIEGSREASRAISWSYGVPPQLIGIPGDNTYSNYKEARLSFWEDTVIPKLEYIKAELNNWFFGDGDLFLDYDLEDIPAISEKRSQLWERAQTSSFITINEKRNIVGMEEIEGGDVVLIPANLLPLGSENEEEKTAEKEQDEEEKQLAELMAQGHTEEEARELLGLNE